MGRTSVADYLFDFERLDPEQAFGEHQGYRTVRWKYGQVAQLAFRFARELTARGIRKGDRVVLWGPNSATWVAAFFGCANRGVIAVPMDHAAATDFSVLSIVAPDAYIVPGNPAYAPGGTSIMPHDFATKLSAQNVADVIAYLDTIK